MEVEISDRKAFEELRAKQIEMQKQLVSANSQLHLKERQKRKSELTLLELSEQPLDTKLYKSVGKAFILSRADTLRAELEGISRDCDADILALGKQRDYLASAAEDADNNVKEFIKSAMKQE